jgi:hypothetical protein
MAQIRPDVLDSKLADVNTIGGCSFVYKITETLWPIFG